jgi:CBS domain-containing protein
MDTVRKLLQVKGNVIFSISADISVYEALEKLEENNLGSLVVLEDNGKLDGIFTERDYARKVILKGRSSRETRVRDIMTEDPIFVTPDTKIEECMKIMSDKNIRHLPVMDKDQLAGLISISDIVRYIMTHKDYIIQNLEHFIVS